MKVKLINCNLDNENKHSLYFSSEENQKYFFNTFEGLTIWNNQDVKQEKETTVRIRKRKQSIDKYNYLIAESEEDGKYKNYYYFIQDVKEINHNLSEIVLKMDYIQSYLFDVTFNQCLVERETVAVDDIRYALEEENLNVGEYEYHSVKDLSELHEQIVVASVLPLGSGTATVQDGVARGVEIRPLDEFDEYSYGILPKLSALIEEYNEAGKIDEILSIWQQPKITFDNEKYFGSFGIHQHEVRNKKLLGYPYHFIEVLNNRGGSLIIKPELCNDPTKFEYVICGSTTENVEVVLTPIKYRKSRYIEELPLEEFRLWEENIRLTGFPQVAFVSDTYKNYVAQNQVSDMMGIGAGVLSAGGALAIGAMTGGVGMLAVGGAVVSGGASVANTIGQYKRIDSQPNSVKGGGSSTVEIEHGKNTFTITHKRISDEQLKKLDDYFDVYGYKVNEIKKPNLIDGWNYKYTKCVDFSCKGVNGIVQEEFKKAFELGITFWRNHSQIGNY